MTGEPRYEKPAHEGRKYLSLLGLGHLADAQIPGRQETAADFLEICGPHAKPMLLALEAIGPKDPRFEPAKAALQIQILGYLGMQQPGEA